MSNQPNPNSGNQANAGGNAPNPVATLLQQVGQLSVQANQATIATNVAPLIQQVQQLQQQVQLALPSLGANGPGLQQQLQTVQSNLNAISLVQDMRATAASFTLHRAAGADDAAKVRRLLDEGADVDQQDDSGMTPCMEAAKNGHRNMVRQLLDAGANLETTDFIGWTVICHAAQANHSQIVRDCAALGASVDSVLPTGLCDLPMTNLLLSLGANPGAQGRHGYTGLTHAAYAGNDKSAAVLLAAGADVNTYNYRKYEGSQDKGDSTDPTNRGWTPMKVAADDEIHPYPDCGLVRQLADASATQGAEQLFMW